MNGTVKMIMTRKAACGTGPRRGEPPVEGFNLIELLSVIGVISLLAALLLPALSYGKAQSRGLSCRNHLKQIGLALAMYVSDARRYPPMLDRRKDQTWAELLYPDAPFSWTNISWHCPSNIAQGGIVLRSGPHDQRFLTSYSYNANGIVGNGWPGAVDVQLRLGLGWLPAAAALEPEVLTPSEMFTVADARAVQAGPKDSRIVGYLSMTPYLLPWNEKKPMHGRDYNLLFADGHVTPMKRSEYLCPPRTASNWNRDNQPHPEA